MDRSESREESFLAMHWVLGLLPVLGLGVLIALFEGSSGPNPLRAASSTGVKHLENPHDFFTASTEIKKEEIESPVIPGVRFVYQKTMVAKVTGYTPGKESCGIYADGKTSIGHDAWSLDGVAADPTLLPYGTIVFVPGVGYREVDDTGIAMRTAWQKDKEVHIDLRFADVDEARRWGVQQLPVHIFIPEP